MEGVGAEPTVSTVHISGLPESADEASLRQLFEVCGTIQSLRFVPGQKYCFVRYSSPWEAQSAVDTLSGANYLGSNLSVQLARSDATRAAAAVANATNSALVGAGGRAPAAGPPPGEAVYIRGLPAGISQESLAGILGAYGDVASCRVLPPGQGGPLAAAVVRMATVEQATAIVDTLDGASLPGQTEPLLVRFADPPGSRQQKRPAPGLAAALPAAVLPTRPTAAAASALGAAGLMGGNNTTAQAAAIMQVLSQAGLLGPELSAGAASAGAAVDPRSLYVKNLPAEADDLYLYKTFAYHGAIESVHAMMGEGGRCSGTGFVKFRHAHEAQEALQSLNGTRLPDGSSLHVSVKTAGKRVRTG